MPARSTVSWNDLFAADNAADLIVPVRVLKKAGEPFLILPASNALAARALALYPAQSSFARLAKTGLSAALRLGLPMGLSAAEIHLARHAAFPEFIIRLAGATGNVFPALSILSGNPNAEGRRFIVLLFDRTGEPAWVVKAGIGDAATQLIQRESSFLQSASAGIPAFPKFRGAFDDGRVVALALDYIAGDSPRGENSRILGNLLSGWLDQTKRVRATDLAGWQILAREHSVHPLYEKLFAKLAGRELFSALYHGDFAPWNIKVSPRDGSWQVLDWERGERAGFPGWDWFHYCVQQGVLVEKLSADELLQKLDCLLASAEFQNYAGRAAISGQEKILATAYLFYCVEILQQSEGGGTVRALLAKAGEKWLETGLK